MKKTITAKTWLPVFGGFYNTIFESFTDCDNEISYINEQREEKGLDPIDYDALKIDFHRALSRLSEKIFDVVTKRLKELNLIQKAKFEKLVSPREYNFKNDSIDCTLTFSKENVKTIREYLEKHSTEWDAYLENHFTSGPGFMSFYDNCSTGSDWNDLEEVLGHKFKSASVLEFILKNQEFDHLAIYYEIDFDMGEFIQNYSLLVNPSNEIAS